MTKHRGQFQPGQSGNPGGRPKDPEVEKFKRALKRVQEETGKDVYEEIIKLALMGNGKALTTVLKKLIPDRKQQELDITGLKSIEIIVTENKKKK